MGGNARMDRKMIREFNEYWEDLYRAFPAARAQAVEAMGQAVQTELNTRIQSADLEAGAKGTVRSWQELRMGSRGGYAALTPRKGRPASNGRKAKTWNGTPVTVKQVTRWLERGHGTRKPAPGSSRQWSRAGRSGIHHVTGTRYVKGRQFYSYTKLYATEVALKAAERVLSHIADEVEY